MTIISLEGIDGAGKTTLIPHLAQHLTNQGHIVHTHALPTPHGRREAQRYPQGSTACALAYATDMADLWETTINPAHRQGHIVILDRGPLSTAVYQSLGTLGAPRAAHIATIGCLNQWPDLTILLDISPQEAHRRQIQRGGAEQDKAVLAVLRRRYLEASPSIPGALRTEFVRSNEETSEVVDSVCEAVDRFLTGHPVQ
jgi:dTMP kinase|nr:MAG TPA: TMPK protein [Caudoviricetes sp.]